MKTPVETISLLRLSLAFMPTAIVVIYLFKWSLNGRTTLYAVARMLIQLMLIGYVLTFVFTTHSSLLVVGVLSLMLGMASWIALRPLAQKSARTYLHALLAIVSGGVLTLALVTQAVLRADPWYAPAVVIPLAGMIFANCMNTVSLSAERYHAERERGLDLTACRNAALQAALIPLTNSLFAVGLVSLPGMMTGQILSGVDPLIAARYQIMVMAMLFGSSGIAAIVFLTLSAPHQSAD
jgi:putative ABC transport system permease protein